MGEPTGTELVVVSVTHNPLARAQVGDGGTDPTDIREASESVATVHGTHGIAGRGEAYSQSGLSRTRSLYSTNVEKYKALLSKRTNKVEKRAMLMSVQGVIFGFTFMMSTFETSNRTMIIIVVASFAGTFGLATHLQHGEAGLACYVAFLVVAGGFVYHAVRSLESVEVFKKKFEAAFAKCTKGIEPRSDQLGP